MINLSTHKSITSFKPRLGIPTYVTLTLEESWVSRENSGSFQLVFSLYSKRGDLDFLKVVIDPRVKFDFIILLF